MIQTTQQRIDEAVQGCIRFVNAQSNLDAEAQVQQAYKISLPVIKVFTDAPGLFQIRVNSLANKRPELRWLSTVELLLMLARAHHFSDNLVQHHLCGILIGLFTIQGKDKASRTARAKPLLQHVQSKRFDAVQEGLQSILRSTKHKSELPSHKAYISVACRVSAIWQKQQTLTLDSLLKSITAIAIKSPDVLIILEPLMLTTSILWQGTIIRHDNGFFCVLGTNKDTLVIAKIESEADATLSIKQLNCDVFFEQGFTGKTVTSSTFVRLLTQLEQEKPQILKGLANQQTYAIQRPPAELIVILDLLKRANSEPSDIADAIDKSPLFSEILARSATQLNRQNITVSNIRQSVMTHGLERISAVLTEHILWQRLTLKQFPLRAQFGAFCELHRSISALLAEHCKMGLAQQFSLMATLHLSGLFTTSTLRTLYKWRPTHSPKAQLNELVAKSAKVDLSQQAHSLAKAWLLSPHLCDVFTQTSISKRETRDFSDVLTVSLHLALQWIYFPEQSENSVFDWCDTQCKRIQLTPQIVQSIRIASAEQLYCPFNV